MDNRRQHARFEVAIAAEIELDGDTLTGETRDISAGGIAALLEEPPEEGSTVDLLLILTQDGIEDASEDPFATRARVMWVAPQDDDRVLVGLRFTETVQAEQQRLVRFLAALAENVAR